MYFAKDAATLYPHTAINVINVYTVCPTYGEQGEVSYI
jgi:hypothetical protein